MHPQLQGMVEAKTFHLQTWRSWSKQWMDLWSVRCVALNMFSCHSPVLGWCLTAFQSKPVIATPQTVLPVTCGAALATPGPAVISGPLWALHLMPLQQSFYRDQLALQQYHGPS